LETSPDWDGFVICRSLADGSYLWHQTHDSVGTLLWSKIGADASGNVVLMGFSTDPVDLGSGEVDTSPAPGGIGDGYPVTTVLSLDQDGGYRWDRQFRYLNGLDLELDGDGNALVTGAYEAGANLGTAVPPANGLDALLIELLNGEGGA
jgi:hypothetical protein